MHPLFFFGERIISIFLLYLFAGTALITRKFGEVSISYIVQFAISSLLAYTGKPISMVNGIYLFLSMFVSYQLGNIILILDLIIENLSIVVSDNLRFGFT